MVQYRAAADRPLIIEALGRPVMKRFFSCFLFQVRPGDGLTAGKRRLFWLWNWGLLILAALAVGLFSLMMAPAWYGWEIFYDYFSHPGLVALNLAPPVVLAVLLYGAAGRSWLACLLTAAPVLALSAGNCYKLYFRNDPVVASDLLLLGEAGNMAGNYQLFLFSKLVIALADYSKFGIKALNVVCGTEKLDYLVTDGKTDQRILRDLKDHGVEVLVAH